MPNNLRELHAYIMDRARQDGLSASQITYAVGWIFFDIFERAEHEEKNNGVTITPADFDRFSKEISPNKINRDIDEAQQEFGRAAADFMEPEIEKRIGAAIETGIVRIVRSYTSGWKTFFANVTAGLVSGVLFAAISLAFYYYVEIDPSVFLAAKTSISQHNQSTNPPISPPAIPAPQSPQSGTSLQKSPD